MTLWDWETWSSRGMISNWAMQGHTLNATGSFFQPPAWVCWSQWCSCSLLRDDPMAANVFHVSTGLAVVTRSTSVSTIFLPFWPEVAGQSLRSPTKWILLLWKEKGRWNVLACSHHGHVKERWRMRVSASLEASLVTSPFTALLHTLTSCWAAGSVTWHWVGPAAAAEAACRGVPTATGDRCSAWPSPWPPPPPATPPAPMDRLGPALVWPPAGRLVSACRTAGRLWSAETDGRWGLRRRKWRISLCFQRRH